jgi:acetyl esterase/lipase
MAITTEPYVKPAGTRRSFIYVDTAYELTVVDERGYDRMADQQQRPGVPSKRRRSSQAHPSLSRMSSASSTNISPMTTPVDSSTTVFLRPGYLPPGRLGTPRMELYQEPRLDPRLQRVLTNQGLQRMYTPASLETLSPTSSLAEVEGSLTEAARGFSSLCDSLPNDLANDNLELHVESRPETITGFDVNLIPLQIYRPVLRGGPLPCVVVCHSGAGIGVTGADSKVHKRWCISLAVQGLIVVSVDYRDITESGDGFHRYRAGLSDVCAAIQHVHQHRDALNIRNIVLQGDGRGANLVLAAAILAKREGWIGRIDGVYATSPYISNAYNWSETRKLQELPSLVECHGYLLNVDFLVSMPSPH